MRIFILFISLISITQLTYAGEVMPERPDYTILSNEIDSTVPKNKARITVLVRANDLYRTNRVLYGYDDTNFEGQINDNNQFSFDLKSGDYSFAFYLESNFREISMKELHVEKGHHIQIQLNFKSTILKQQVKKPVIYAYSDLPRDLDISVIPNGEMKFTYPIAENNLWKVKVDSSGMTFQGEKLNYLFWESEMNISESEIDLKVGKVLSSKEVTAYLDESLTNLGFTLSEKADFITYWVPEILNYEDVYVQILIDDQCDLFGTLAINPSPENLHRVYLLWTSKITSEMGVYEQFFSELDREDFNVLEWGGVELKLEPEF